MLAAGRDRLHPQPAEVPGGGDSHRRASGRDSEDRPIVYRGIKVQIAGYQWTARGFRERGMGRTDAGFQMARRWPDNRSRSSRRDPPALTVCSR